MDESSDTICGCEYDERWKGMHVWHVRLNDDDFLFIHRSSDVSHGWRWNEKEMNSKCITRAAHHYTNLLPVDERYCHRNRHQHFRRVFEMIVMKNWWKTWKMRFFFSCRFIFIFTSWFSILISRSIAFPPIFECPHTQTRLHANIHAAHGKRKLNKTQHEIFNVNSSSISFLCCCFVFGAR